MPVAANSLDQQSTRFKASLAVAVVVEVVGKPCGRYEAGTARTLLGLFGDEWFLGD